MAEGHDIDEVVAKLNQIEERAKRSYVWEFALRSIVGVAVAIAIPWATYIQGTTADHESRLAVIESNRFTLQDAVQMERRIVDRPLPRWIQDVLTRITSDLVELKSEIREIHKSLKK